MSEAILMIVVSWSIGRGGIEMWIRAQGISYNKPGRRGRETESQETRDERGMSEKPEPETLS